VIAGIRLEKSPALLEGLLVFLYRRAEFFLFHGSVHVTERLMQIKYFLGLSALGMGVIIGNSHRGFLVTCRVVHSRCDLDAGVWALLQTRLE